MVQSVVGIVVALVVGGRVLAQGPVPLPKDVPPILGVAVVSDPGKDDSEWKVSLTLPKVIWEVVGKIDPKKQWPELKAEVETASLTLRLGGPSQLAESRVMDLKGKELSRNQIQGRLEKETPILISLSGKMPDAYFLQLTKPESLIVILGPRDGYPAPQLLPAKKESASE